MKTIVLIGTLETKGAEYKYIKRCIEEKGCKTLVIDAGILDTTRFKPDVTRAEMARDIDLLTTPYVFNTEDATQMAKAGADIIVAHMGTTVSGSIGAKTVKSLDESVDLINRIIDAAKTVRDDIIFLCHGGPIAEPEDAEYIIKTCIGIDGFYGASSMERLPVERAIKEQTEQFMKIRRS